MMSVEILENKGNLIDIAIRIDNQEYRIRSAQDKDGSLLTINAHPGTLFIEPRAANSVWLSQK